MQNEIVGEEISEGVGKSQFEAVGDGDRDASETGLETKGGGDDPPTPTDEKRSVGAAAASERTAFKAGETAAATGNGDQGASGGARGDAEESRYAA